MTAGGVAKQLMKSSQPPSPTYRNELFVVFKGGSYSTINPSSEIK